MKWLIWKDFRVNRVVFITIVVLNILPHLLAIVFEWRFLFTRPAELFGPASIWALAVLQLTFALLGGNSIAGERMDRSAEFLAYMPVSRGRLLASRLLITAAAAALVWLPNLLVVAPILYRDTAGDLLAGLGMMAVTGNTFFCAAWCFSCMLESPTFSAAAGILTPGLVALALLMSKIEDFPLAGWYYLGICLTISIVSFVIGTRYYLRRVEP